MSYRSARQMNLGKWDRDEYHATLFLEDHRGGVWAVTADRDGTWRVQQAPLRYEDDPRRYYEGDVHQGLTFVSTKEAFTAAKKQARDYLKMLFEALAEEEDS